MRKSALVFAALMVAAAPTAALAAKKASPANPNANTQKFLSSAAEQPGHVVKGLMSPLSGQKAKAPAKTKTKAKAKK